MFSELLQQIENQYAKNFPFVVYRKPKEELVHLVLQKDATVHYIKDFSETGFVFSPFDSREKSVLLLIDYKLQATYNPSTKLEFKTKDISEANSTDKELHINLVKKGIAEIRKGEFKKVVLSRKVESPYDSKPIDLFQKLLDAYPTAFCYLWHHPKVGTWLGATPEILLKIENRQLTTMSLAGTQQYVANETPHWVNKELSEQQLVTDYIAAALENSVSNLNIGERESIRAGNLWHLRTKLKGQIEKGSLSKIISMLHPTPAVCGMPMHATKEFILENENYNREFYTGFLGELNLKSERQRATSSRNQENKAYRALKTQTTLFVNLRCMQLKEDNARIYVGGGITQESDSEKEWLETVAKSATMLRVLF
jgi:isochorismate synthase